MSVELEQEELLYDVNVMINLDLFLVFYCLGDSLEQRSA